MMYASEKQFSDAMKVVLADAFDDVVMERKVTDNGDLRRVDAFVTDGLFRYAVEMKTHNRTARMDQCLGQALVKAYHLNATPVCLFPDDVRIDKTFSEAAAHYGVMVASESDVVAQIKTGRLPLEV